VQGSDQSNSIDDGSLFKRRYLRALSTHRIESKVIFRFAAWARAAFCEHYGGEPLLGTRRSASMMTLHQYGDSLGRATVPMKSSRSQTSLHAQRHLGCMMPTVA